MFSRRLNIASYNLYICYRREEVEDYGERGAVDYTTLPEPRNVGPGKPFTRMQHKNAIELNKKMNGEIIRDDVNGSVLNVPKQDKRGVPSDMNSAQLDHKNAKNPKDKTKPAGTNSNSNISIRSKRSNVNKSNN